jgi:hypothetical protein
MLCLWFGSSCSATCQSNQVSWFFLYSNIVKGIQLTGRLFYIFQFVRRDHMNMIHHNSVVNFEDDDNNDIVDMSSPTAWSTNAETTVSVNFNYPSVSNVCQRYSIESKNAETAGTVAAADSAKMRHLDRGGGIQCLNDLVDKRVYLKHQHINQFC